MKAAIDLPEPAYSYQIVKLASRSYQAIFGTFGTPKVQNTQQFPIPNLKMAFQPVPSIDSETAHLPSHPQATPLTDLEAAHLPHELSRDPSRPPSYGEEDMAEPLPTYMEAVRRKMKQAMPYPTETPSKSTRFWLSIVLALVQLALIAVPIAVSRERINSDNP